MLTASKFDEFYNPMDTIELIFSNKSVDFERRGNNEVVVEIEGKWNNMLFNTSFHIIIFNNIHPNFHIYHLHLSYHSN